ncbi:ArsR/SmtB family transcription factor [Nakamurella sp. GG22]
MVQVMLVEEEFTLRQSLPARTDEDDLGRVAEMFKLLGDPTRCRILYALLAEPDLRVQDIATGTVTPRTTVSAALRLLPTAGVVVGRREGRTVHYRVADEHVAELLTVAWQHTAHAESDADIDAPGDIPAEREEHSDGDGHLGVTSKAVGVL